MSKKSISVARVKATLSEDLETLERLRAAGPEGGLASIAGGWEHAEDLVRLLDASARIGAREGNGAVKAPDQRRWT